MESLNQFRKAKRNSVIGDLTSLIDVIFLLLIFFLLTSVTNTPNREESVQASKQGASAELTEVLYIQVTPSNTYKVDSLILPLDEFFRYLETQDISKEQPIAITSQEGALYSQVLSSVAPLVELGWRNISFVVE
jgi:biopolymer transport protein ExbD